LDGGLFKLDTGPVDVTLFGGQIESAQNTRDERYQDVLYGGQVRVPLPLGARIGLNGVVVDEDEDFVPQRKFTVLGGDFSYASPGGGVELYVEYQDLDISVDEAYFVGETTGSALYGSLIFSLAGFVIEAEYKDYENWIHPYSNPPSADRVDEANDVENVVGPRLKVDYLIVPIDLLLYVSYSQFESQDGNTDYDHAYVGLEQHAEHYDLTATYGDRMKENQATADLIDRQGQERFTMDLTVFLADRHSVNLYVETLKETQEIINRNTDLHLTQVVDLNKSYLSYSFSPTFIATVHYAWDRSWQGKLAGENLWGGEIVLQPWDFLTLKAFYGALPGGLVCSGGVCRILPDFEGYKLEATYRF